METSQHPHIQSLGQRGYIQGTTIVSKSTNSPLCHYFGGLRYALPPAQRWRRAHPLPSSYTYGTKEQPGRHDGKAGVCPQPGFRGPADETGWSEDCFQCNVWVPVGEAPKEEWPVFVFLHGGWLQFGTPNSVSLSALLSETDFKAIIVLPAYRLNVFGFLYSSELEQDAVSAGETVGNHGFWDQRLALEWTKENIHLFGGNAANITISGYSAGAYSVFHQLAYDLRLPKDISLVKQAIIWSNGPAVQSKSPSETQLQFNQFLSALNIPFSLPASEKIARLRALPAKALLSAASSIDIHQFRPTTDSAFIPASLFQSLDNGDFARRVAERNVRIMLGECRDEHSLYGIWYPPSSNSLPALRQRLLADYPRRVVDTLINHYYPAGQLPADCKNWDSDAFGRIYADMQVHKMQRGLVHALVTGGAAHCLYRYRIEYRLKCADHAVPPEWGVTHVTDQYMWFWGNGDVLEAGEKDLVKQAFLESLARFVRGDAEINWGTGSYREVRTLKPDGSVEISNDALWDDALRVWKALREVGEPMEAVSAVKL
ncbi:hypothetical protein ASPWEDRAFT_102513 [Aspergillus wentii DTO 134E9]|uniref:Carboxylic ester hydrolase n=1 Tax=Aspergillus wentii DTO 134E9 TaxID=1073089 RepID=A0A1L9S1P2_ASPWE|nr:uncharacterized protein ASPWEDRAFT_102513 [Aspergillus wentii DTO 134E9]OJJ41076.1 hypothetical protein ASPWEDRAFT_102513 [Aspergillus wentii DTO 134E9]